MSQKVFTFGYCTSSPHLEVVQVPEESRLVLPKRKTWQQSKRRRDECCPWQKVKIALSLLSTQKMIPLHDTTLKISSTQQEGSSHLNGRVEIGRKEGRRSEGKVGRMLAGKVGRRLTRKGSS